MFGPVRIVRYLLGVFFVLAGANHFLSPDTYLEMMPSWIPLHGPAVFWSGVAEVVGGIALLVDRWKRFGCWWTIALLIAVFPANIQMAITPDQIPWVAERNFPDWLLWVRLLLQPLLMYLVWWSCDRPPLVRRSPAVDAEA
ncbi:MAG: DoxX family membrane protein [Solirubrobacterales bacterium]|nr:DoxX family membrane protein [Solirubrobacterales bacterium]